MPKLSEVTAEPQKKRKLSEVTGANNSDFGRMVSGKPKGDAARNEKLVYGGGPAVLMGDFADAFQHRALDAAYGTGQLIHKGVTAVADAVLPEGNGLRNVIDRVDKRGPAYLAKREADYQARVPDNAASYAGAATGAVAPWMAGLGELRAAGALPQIESGVGFMGRAAEIAKKGGLLALGGAAQGAATPVTGDGSYGAQKGVQVGVGAAAAPVLAGGMGLAGMTGRGIAALGRYTTEGGREQIANARLAKMLGDAPGTLEALRSPSGVAGMELSPSQALGSVQHPGTVRAVQAERVLRNNGETAPAFAERESANNAAMRDQVTRVAGTDADMQAAAQARRDGPGAFWKENLPRGAENGRYGRAQSHLSDFINSRPLPMPEFNILNQARLVAGQVERGTISQEQGDKIIRQLQPTTKGGKKALEQALGQIDGGMVNPSRLISHLQDLSKDTNKTISGAANDALASLAKNQDGQGWVHARVLDGLRQNLGTLIQHNAPANAAVGSREGAAFGPLKAKIVNSLDRAVPGYRDNLAAYASASAPINDMEAGRALLAAIDSGGRDGGGHQAVNLAAVKAMLAKNNRADFPMSEGATKQIEAVLEALQKRSVSNNNIAAPGPGTAADVQRALRASPLLMRLMGHAAAAIGGVAGGVTGGVGGYAIGHAAGVGAVEGANALNNLVVRKVGQKAASAPAAADALEAYRMQTQRPSSPLMDLMMPYTRQRQLPRP